MYKEKVLRWLEENFNLKIGSKFEGKFGLRAKINKRV